MSASDGWVAVDACTLPTEEQPLRAAEFDAVFATALNRVERPAPERLRLILDGSAVTASAVRDLVARESSCCSFFGFRLTASTDDLVLDVQVPAARIAVLDGLARRAEGARAPRESA
ncbi:hypothetical protein FHX44_115162 [Pseudonocardia hierapolitana]|uniref:Arsenate reductase n=1 Tax=Pseudonocardia hierapolitana TaxID=1128676 RepID=A0A561SWJ7_9PSEU|nr:hypothetical protein [Pseudonocardia hierapolitana]TWF79234.1 hypothetical protein FHX44_115162 [Pseudonocardia hierapolitana]